MDKARAEQAVAETSWEELLGWAAALTDDRRAEARRWYRSSLRAKARGARLRDRGARLLDTAAQGRVVQVGLAIALSETPDEASKNCAWSRDFGVNDRYGACSRLSALLLARGHDWAAEFAEHAVSTSARGESAQSADEIAAIVAPVYALFGLEIRPGTFPLGWAQLVTGAFIASASPHAGRWFPPRLPHVDEAGVVAPAYGFPTSLAEVLRATPRLRDVLLAALQTPDALAGWSRIKADGWDVADSIARLIDQQELDSGPVIEGALAALARADSPSAQVATAAILRGAGFGPADARKHASLVSHLMPTVHGRVTAVLLPAVLDGEPADDVLLDVGQVILARSEKTQKSQLLDYLARHPGSAAAASLLETAANDLDSAFAAKARRALGTGADAAAAAVPDLGYTWALEIQGRQPGPFRPWSADPAGLDSARSDSQTWIRITSNALWLDLISRFGFRDLAALRQQVLSGPKPPDYTGNRVAPLLYKWCSRGDAAPSYTYQSRSMTADPESGRWIEQVSPPTTLIPPGHRHFTDRLTEETLLRLGTVPELLSTPSRADGTISSGDLLARLKRLRSAGIGSYDLVQALLRLEPTAPADARRFAKVSASVGTHEQAGAPAAGSRVLSAGEVISNWITAGGLPERTVTIVDGEVSLAGVRLPLPPELARLDGLDDLCRALSLPSQPGAVRRPLISSGEVAHYLGVVPRWVDAAAAMLEVAEGLNSVYTVRRLVFIAAASGQLGIGAHHLLARLQSHPRQDARLSLVEHLADFARQGRLDGDLLRDQTVERFRSGELSLARLAHTWEHAFASGLMMWVWPAAIAVLGEALRMARRPAGLAELIRAITPAVPVARRYWDTGRLPGGLAELAASKSTAGAAEEARVLMAAAGKGQR